MYVQGVVEGVSDHLEVRGALVSLAVLSGLRPRSELRPVLIVFGLVLSSLDRASRDLDLLPQYGLEGVA